jgi:acyl-CoA synthetase (AMP-forming)/AMP-acid ligase II
LRAGAIDALADHYAARLAEADLPRGTRLLLLSPPEPRTLSAIVGALRTGFDVALATPSLDVASIAAVAEDFGASAMAGPTEFAELRTGERIFEAAALVETIRLVALHGAGEPARSGWTSR